MPTHPKHPCLTRGCPELVERGQARCPAHTRADTKAADEARGSSGERGYGSRWAKARLVYLRQHPLCVRCLAGGRVTPGMVVDHIVAHRGDERLFWDQSNWQTLCDWRTPWNCHGVKTEAEERGAICKSGVNAL